MRLRQLSRKLGVHPNKILTVLTDTGHELENDPNSKLTAEQVEIVQSRFPAPAEPETKRAESDPEVSAEEMPSETPVEMTVAMNETEAIPEAIQVEAEVKLVKVDPDLEHLEVPFGPPSHATSQVSASAPKPENQAASSLKKQVITLAPKTEFKVYNAIEEDEEFINAELIKTEKPVLEGLKVVGKIDLPELKKPVVKGEETIEKTEENESSKVNRSRRNDRNSRGRGQRGKKERKRLSPLEYERQKAQRQAKKKKQEAERKLKKKKEEHYKATLEAKAKAKARRKKQPVKPKKVTAQIEETLAPLPINGMSRPKPEVKKEKKKQRSPLKRFWSWLNGDYDQF